LIVYFRFRNYSNTDAVFVSDNTVSLSFPIKNYKNKSDGAFRLTVFIPSIGYAVDLDGAARRCASLAAPTACRRGRSWCASAVEAWMLGHGLSSGITCVRRHLCFFPADPRTSKKKKAVLAARKKCCLSCQMSGRVASLSCRHVRSPRPA